MINFRTIFNPSYNYIGLIIIIIINLLIILNNKNLQKSLHQIGVIGMLSSLFTLIISMLIKFILNNMIPYQYKLFIEVISENVFQTITTLSVIGIILGLLCMAISKFFFNKPNQKASVS